MDVTAVQDRPAVGPPRARRTRRIGWALLAALLAAASATYAGRQVPSDVISYRRWIRTGWPSWGTEGPYPVGADLFWYPLRFVHASNVNPSWVVFWTAPVTVVAVLVLWRGVSRPWAAIGVWLLAAAVLERTYWLRLEPVAAVIALVGLVTAVRGRARVSGLALAAGAIVKVWPAFLVPFALLVTTGARRVRWIVAFAAPWVAYAVAMIVERPKHGLDWLTFTFSRPIQIESYSGLPAMIAMAFGNHDWKITYVKGMNSAFILSGPHLKGVHALVELLGLVALALLARRLWTAHRATLLRGTAENAAGSTTGGTAGSTAGGPLLGFPLEQALLVQLIVLLVLIVAGPVFSPQYMVWLAPVFALAAGEGLLRRETAVYIACCALTALVYPLFYDLLIKADPGAVTVLVARDVAVLALLGFAWQRLWRLTAAPSATAPTADATDPAVTTGA